MVKRQQSISQRLIVCHRQVFRQKSPVLQINH